LNKENLTETGLHAKMLRKAKVILWDEAPMMKKVHATNLIALDKLSGSAAELNGCDSIVEGDGRHYILELLNSLKPIRTGNLINFNPKQPKLVAAIYAE
jgi:hypothetical protein